MANYEFELSEASITELINKVKKNKEKLEEIKIKVLNRLAEYTKQQIEIHIGDSTPFGTGDLINDFHISEIVDDTISVYTTNDHALFVEYGTGIVSQNNPHGEKGWWYTDKFGEKHWTKGQKAHKFMLNSYNDLVREAMNITKQVLKEEGFI